MQREGSTNVVEDDSSFSYENQLEATLMNSAVNGVASLAFTNENAPPFSTSGFSVAASQSGNPFGLITGSFGITRDTTGEIVAIAKDGTTLFTKSYDPAGRLTGVSAPGGFSTALGYDGFGRKASVAHSNGETGSFQHDLLDRITAVSWTGSTPISESLSFDLAGNPTQITRESGTSTVAYDAVDQLTSSTGGLYGGKNYVYDALGNRVGGSDGVGSIVSNFLTSNGTTSFLADPDGFGDTIRETNGAVVKNYAYRADGLFNASQSGTTQLAYYFDPLKRRVAKVVNLGGTTYSESYVHLGNEDRILMAKGGDGTISTYLDGQGVDEHLAEVKNGVGKGYVTDHLGSLLNGDAAGSAHGFGLFGESSALSPAPTSSPVKYGFAGRELEESGLYYNRARQYSPATGRFLSQDPIGLDSDDANFYRYASNAPTIATDPNGTSITFAEGAVVFVVAGGLVYVNNKTAINNACSAAKVYTIEAAKKTFSYFETLYYAALRALGYDCPGIAAKFAACMKAAASNSNAQLLCKRSYADSYNRCGLGFTGDQ